MDAEFDSDLVSVSAARAFVAAALAAWDVDDVGELAALLTSEVVTNVVLHARTAFRVAIELVPPDVVVEVWDASPVLPRLRLGGTERENGRGLVLIDSLAARWGSRRDGEGKTVWFALRAGSVGR